MVRRSVTIKYVHTPTAKGKTYAYYRRNGQRIPMAADPGDNIALAAEAAELSKRFESPSMPEAGTLSRLINDYKASYRYPANISTRESYERAFAVLTEGQRGSSEVARLTRAGILQLRDKKIYPEKGYWMANNTTTVLGILLQFAEDTGVIERNPLQARVRRIPPPEGHMPANRPWSTAERNIVMAECPASLRLPLALAMCAGLRKADIAAATLSSIKDGEVTIRTSKRGVPIRIPIHPMLAAAIEARPQSNSLMLCLRPNGKPISKSGIDTAWHRLKSRLVSDGKIAQGLTLHGLRHTLATMLKELNVSNEKIAQVLGQKSLSMAQHYSDGAQLDEDTKGIILNADFGK